MNLGWRVSFDGPIRSAWRDGRLILNDIKVSYGAIDIDSNEEGFVSTNVAANAPTSNPSDNYTRFRFELDRVELKVSLLRFLAGRGLIEEASIDGARGLLDKRFVQWIEGWRWRHRPGDLDMKHLSLRNVHFQVIQPVGYHPYSVTILQATLPRLRLPWLFYDFLNAEKAQGIFDGHSLFTLESDEQTKENSLDSHRQKRFKLLGMDVKHLTATAADASSPLTWLTKGFVDIEASWKMPKTGDEVREEDDRDLERAIEKVLLERLLEVNEIASDSQSPTEALPFNVSFTFRNLKARQPSPQEVENLLGSSSRLKMALLVPVLGYLNEHRPEIALSCVLSLNRADFLGVWSGWECGLFGGVAQGLDEAFRRLVWDPERRMRRIGKVGKYALQALLLNKPLLD